MPADTKLHRCTECGRVAEWHYIIGRDPKNPHSTTFFTGLAAGTRCWAPGQGSIGVLKHVLSPDFSDPFTEASLQTLRAAGA